MESFDRDLGDIVDQLSKGLLVAEIFGFSREKFNLCRGKKLLKCPAPSEPFALAERKFPAWPTLILGDIREVNVTSL
jgi:hypothetical protein